jgi:glycosyltransferase involved in cell wall biosynthesis
VVIATRDRPDLLAKCLASVRAAMSPADELIVVDSASADPRGVEQVSLAAGGRALRLPVPGSARARNLGASEARGSFLAFTDDDAVVDPGWLDALARRFSDQAVAAVTGPVFEMGPELGKLLLHFPALDPSRDETSFDRRGDDWFRRAHLGAIGSGANLAVRRDVFASVGPFRTGLGAGAPIAGDENYFLLSLLEEGHRVVNEPAARVHHPRQSDARLRQILEARTAYFLYVAWTRPALRWSCAKLLASKLIPGSTLGGGLAGPEPSLVRELLSAPRRLLAARHMDGRAPAD